MIVDNRVSLHNSFLSFLSDCDNYQINFIKAQQYTIKLKLFKIINIHYSYSANVPSNNLIIYFFLFFLALLFILTVSLIGLL